MFMQDWLAQRAMRSPERVALYFEQRAWTWRELDARVNDYASELAARGITENARVAALMQNSDAYVVLVHALARCGAVLVPINTRLTANEIAWQLHHIHAQLLIHDDANAAKANVIQESARAKILNASEVESARVRPLSFGVRHLHLDAPASILFTSGTTGKPKGAALTYGNHWHNAIASALNLGLRDDDVWLACLPLFHIGGLAILWRSVIYGNPVVLHETFDAHAVNRALDEQRVTMISLVSTMLRRVLDVRAENAFPLSLRCVLLGGGPAPRDVLERCAKKNVPVVQTYGLTEAASQVATLAPQDALRKLGSAGKPLFGVELKIEGDARRDVGEILIRGASVMRAYAEDEQATARAFREGWFHTGDLGYLDDEGFLYVVARRDDLIVSGGENIYPAQVENVLRAHPDVLDAAVVGVADAEWGQTPVAYCVLREPNAVSAQALKIFCGENLARYKIPTRIIFVSTLPRNAAGKILRNVLRARAESENARENQTERE
jgi:O-succinylbenzoic acid--CoA ligase